MTDYDSERRRQRALERLGTNNPRCVICGKANPHCLERHHILGRTHGDETVIVCRNCHRELSDRQKDHPKQIGDPPSLGENVGYLLLNLADLFAELIEVLRHYGRQLIDRARAEMPTVGGQP
ncbi:hypothetical protein SAMN05444161_5848 [Rhizobiales bacterium GAS191]|nr:hypothetical protein SAMN05444161_5848 [Rhizobiales bacterium GAS191]